MKGMIEVKKWKIVLIVAGAAAFAGMVVGAAIAIASFSKRKRLSAEYTEDEDYEPIPDMCDEDGESDKQSEQNEQNEQSAQSASDI